MSTATFICATKSKKCAYLDHSYFLHPNIDNFGKVPDYHIITDWSQVHKQLYNGGLSHKAMVAFLQHQIGESCDRKQVGWLESVLDFCNAHKGDLFFAFNDTEDYATYQKESGERGIIWDKVYYQQEND